MAAIAGAVRPLSAAGAVRLARAEAMRRPPADFDRREAERRFDALLAGAER
jgi:hypothetical protein